MRFLVLSLCFPLLIGTAVAADDVAACKSRQAELSTKATQFQGESMMKRLIQADLDRAMRELLEGDAEECNEALDHASQLIDGKV